MRWAVALVLWRGLEDVEEPLAVGAHLEDARAVAAAVAVVGRGPDRREVVVEQGREALHAELVRAQDVRHLVRFQELVHDAGAEGVARTPVAAEQSVSGRSLAGSEADVKEARPTSVILQSLPSPDQDLTIRGLPLGPRAGFLV